MTRHIFLLSATLSALCVSSAQAQFAPAPTYTITAQCSGMVLTVRGDPHVECILLQEPVVPNDPRQRWTFVPTPDGSTKIVNPCTGMALEVVDGRERTPVLVFPARQSPTQNWWLTQINGTVHYVFMPALHTDRFLDVPFSATHVSQVQIYRPNYGVAQRWTITPVQ
jgi:hypothetical protein